MENALLDYGYLLQENLPKTVKGKEFFKWAAKCSIDSNKIQ